MLYNKNNVYVYCILVKIQCIIHFVIGKTDFSASNVRYIFIRKHKEVQNISLDVHLAFTKGDLDLSFSLSTSLIKLPAGVVLFLD